MRVARVAKLAIAIALIPFACLLAGCGNVAQSAAQSTGPTVTIGISTDLPYLSLQEGSRYSGFDVDVARFVARQLGYSYKQIIWKQVPLGQRVEDLNDGVVDMIIGDYPITAKNKREVDFAGPYLVQGQRLLVGAKDDSVKSAADLAGKSVCVTEGSPAGAVLRSVLGSSASIRALPSAPQCVTELLDGSVQAVSAGGVMLSTLNKFKGDGYLKIVGPRFASEYMGIAVKKNSPGLVYQMNKDLKLMMSSGVWERDFKATVGQSDYEATSYNMPSSLSAQNSQLTANEGTGKHD